MAKSDKSIEASGDQAFAEDPLAKFPDGPEVIAPTVVHGSVPDHSEYQGLFKRVKFPNGADGDGALFMLAKGSDEPSGRTHFLKNKTHFVNVTPEDFRAQFDKQ